MTDWSSIGRTDGGADNVYFKFNPRTLVLERSYLVPCAKSLLLEAVKPIKKFTDFINGGRRIKI